MNSHTDTMSPTITDPERYWPEIIDPPSRNDWIYTTEELKNSPSVINGIKYEDELKQYQLALNIIIRVSADLKLPKTEIFYSMVYLYRFYQRCSMKYCHPLKFAQACLFVATKKLEDHRGSKPIALRFTKYYYPTKDIDESSKEYWNWRDELKKDEPILLGILCFDLQLINPYAFIQNLLNNKDQNHQLLFQYVMGKIELLSKCQIFLLFKVEDILLTIFIISSIRRGIKFPKDYLKFDITPNEIVNIKNATASLVSHPLLRSDTSFDYLKVNLTVQDIENIINGEGYEEYLEKKKREVQPSSIEEPNGNGSEQQNEDGGSVEPTTVSTTPNHPDIQKSEPIISTNPSFSNIPEKKAPQSSHKQNTIENNDKIEPSANYESMTNTSSITDTIKEIPIDQPKVELPKPKVSADKKPSNVFMNNTRVFGRRSGIAPKPRPTTSTITAPHSPLPSSSPQAPTPPIHNLNSMEIDDSIEEGKSKPNQFDQESKKRKAASDDSNKPSFESELSILSTPARNTISPKGSQLKDSRSPVRTRKTEQIPIATSKSNSIFGNRNTISTCTTTPTTAITAKKAPTPITTSTTTTRRSIERGSDGFILTADEDPRPEKTKRPYRPTAGGAPGSRLKILRYKSGPILDVIDSDLSDVE